MPQKSLEDLFWQMSGDVILISRDQLASSKKLRGRFWEPKTDLLEDNAYFVLKCELAGVNPTEVGIIYLPDRHSLLLHGVRREMSMPGSKNIGCHLLEIYYGEFEREIQLPEQPIEAEQIQAHMKNGILYVLVPKARIKVRHVRVTIHEA